MKRKTASDFSPEVLQLFDQYVHGQIDRRQFLNNVAKCATGGLTAVAILESLSPNYALAEQVPKDDPNIVADYQTYESPQGHGTMKGYLVRPKDSPENLPGVLVVHENRGLNPYVEDVARRTAMAGFLAFAPDALTPLGGYPGNDDEGREMQRKLDSEKITEDMIAAAKWLHDRPECSGKVGVVGFCFGGGIANTLAVRIPDIIDAAVPFYGRQPDAADVAKIKAPILIQNAGLDARILEGAPAYTEALKKNGVEFTEHVYPDVNHGFHNDTTPRYDEEAAKLAWERTIEFFNKHLKEA